MAAMNPKDIAALTRAPLHLLPAVGIIYGAMACRNGLKYGPYNWREKPVSLMEYTSAIRRHILAILDGQDCDRESGLPHLAHVIATASIMLDAEAVGMLRDDRPKLAGTAAELLDRLRREAEAGPRAPAAAPAVDSHALYGCQVHGLSDTECCDAAFVRARFRKE